MIKLFDPVVAFGAVVSHGTLHVVCNVRAILTGVKPERPPSVLFCFVVVKALFGVVVGNAFTGVRFEGREVDAEEHILFALR